MGLLTLFRPLASLLSPGGKRAKLSILIYHQVLRETDPYRNGTPDAATFDWQMRLLARQFNVLPLAEAVKRLQDGSLPQRAAVITFDDGYADNEEVALPILKKHGLSATFFIATGYLNGGCMWNDKVTEAIKHTVAPQLDLEDLGLGCYELGGRKQRIKSLHALLLKIKYLPFDERDRISQQIADRLGVTPSREMMMTTAQVKNLYQAGMEIGAHTMTHPILACTEPQRAREEIAGGKQALESMIGAPVRTFAYPNGKPGSDYASLHVDIARQAGFEAVVSTTWGISRRDSDRWQLPRFTPWDSTPAMFYLRLLGNCLSRPAPTL